MLHLLGLFLAVQVTNSNTKTLEESLCDSAIMIQSRDIGDYCKTFADILDTKEHIEKNEVKSALTHFESGLGFYRIDDNQNAIQQLSIACTKIHLLHLEKKYHFVFEASQRFYPGVFK